MKKKNEKETTKFVLTKKNLLRRNPIPFGDIRKYFLAMKVGTVVLFALLLYISFAAVLTRTEYVNQISNVVIGCMLLFALASVIGIYSRTVLGYATAAISSLLLFLLLQYSNGTGIKYTSENLAYGEYFIKGVQSMAFWVILSKVLALLNAALAIVFINSTIKVTEEPPIVGMNVKIRKFQEWLSKNNDSLEDGRRPLDYWFAGASILLYMGYIVGDNTMLVYDYFSLILFVVGLVFIACRQTLMGSFFCFGSALLRCNMYQYRFGYILPVIAAYLGMWLVIIYMAFASAKKRKKVVATDRRQILLGQFTMWWAVFVAVGCFSLHQVFGDFVHEFLYLSTLKDNLPVFFFVPLLSFLLIRSNQWSGYLCASISYLFMWRNLLQIPSDSVKNPLLDCAGDFQVHAERILRLSISTMRFISLISCILCFVSFVVSVIMIRRNAHGNQE